MSKGINVRCECKECGAVITMEKKELARDGYKCPKCGCEECRILL